MIIDCPAPSPPSAADTLYRFSTLCGFLGDVCQIDDETALAGYSDGRSWRIRWGLFTGVTGAYVGSRDTREEAARVTAGLGISFRPIPY